MQDLVRRRVQWIGKEAVRVNCGDVACEATCTIAAGSVTVVIPDAGEKLGVPSRLTAGEVQALETTLRAELGVKKLFGIPVRRREVFVVRQQHVS